MTTRQSTAQKLLAYLHHELPLPQLVEWAERALMNGGLEQGHEATLRETLGALGLADVREYGLLWEDCERMLHQLGYEVRVDAVRAA